MKTIASRQNAEIKAVAALHKSKERAKQRRFVAEGLRTVKTLLTSYKPIAIYVSERMLDDPDLNIAKNKLTLVVDQVMEKISTAKTPPGILAVFTLPTTPTEPLTPGLVLANINNPGNMGTLIRTAAAMNIKTIVVVEGTDPWSPKVVQASVGTSALVNIYELTWEQLITQKNDLELIALVVKDGLPPEQLSFDNALLIVGNEATGIPKHWLTDCKKRCTLTMPGKTESLNAAVAGSIALYVAFGKQ